MGKLCEIPLIWYSLLHRFLHRFLYRGLWIGRERLDAVDVVGVGDPLDRLDLLEIIKPRTVGEVVAKLPQRVSSPERTGIEKPRVDSDLDVPLLSIETQRLQGC